MATLILTTVNLQVWLPIVPTNLISPIGFSSAPSKAAIEDNPVISSKLSLSPASTNPQYLSWISNNLLLNLICQPRILVNRVFQECQVKTWKKARKAHIFSPQKCPRRCRMKGWELPRWNHPRCPTPTGATSPEKLPTSIFHAANTTTQDTAQVPLDSTTETRPNQD